MVRLAFAPIALVAAVPAFAQPAEEPERCPRFVADAAPPTPLVRVAYAEPVQARASDVQLT